MFISAASIEDIERVENDIHVDNNLKRMKKPDFPTKNDFTQLYS
jgi:hypothetical protein